MAYVEIENFKGGLDTRRPAIVGESGTLIKAINGHITRGGDFESCKKFVPYFGLEAGSFGLHAANNKLYVFGSGTPPTNLLGNIVYQRLEHPDTLAAPAMSDLLDADNYDGKVYAVASFDDGSIYHYYDGARVTDWDSLAGTIADDASAATYLSDKIDSATAFLSSVSGLDVLVTAAVPGTAFTIATSVTGTGTLTTTQIQANQAAVAEVRAVGSFEITDGFAFEDNVISSITADGTELLSADVAYVLDNEATALACVIAINSGTGTHGYSAAQDGAVVEIKAPVGAGAGANGDVVAVVAENLVVVDNITNFSGGVTAVAALPQIEKVAVGGTFATANTYTITLNGTPYKITGLSAGYGRIAKTFRTKMHSAVRALMPFSDVDAPTAWTTGAGAANINISSQDQGSQRLTALGIYQNRFAIFTRETVQIWGIDPDPALNNFQQLLENTGTRSPQAVIGYGNSDLMYLSDTGIRSLKARDSSNAAFVDDIGTRIDSEVIDFLATLTDEEIEQAPGVVDPTDGRAWIALKNRIYVFSYFPGSKVSAWSYYEPEFTVEHMAVSNRRIYLRSGNQVYIYGGVNGNTYPDEGEITVTARLPFLDANRLAGGKQIEGVDVICGGDWTLQLLVDPRDETLRTSELHVAGPTTLLYRLQVVGNTTHFAPELTSSKGGRLTFSSVVVHFEDTETQ
jgi:hypothetical protein